MPPDGAGATLKPWTSSSDSVPSLGATLAQIQFERGHFRDITEESLRDEIAGGENHISQSNSEDDDEEAEEDSQQVRKQPTTRQELYAVRQDFINHASQAHQDVLVALDMISLVQSTYATAQAATTLSPAAKQVVPLSSLGVDVWARTPAVPGRDAQNSLIATNVRAKYLNESADSLLSAATRLQDNVRKEKQYWDQILDITAKGWNVSRIPNQRQRLLGVHFGFSGSAHGPAGRNIAALIPDEEGNIKLERGVGSRPKAVRVVVKRGGIVVGRSRLPSLPDISETTLEARIRHARDSVYDEELYHEMIRESRSLRSRGIVMKGSIIEFAISEAEDSPRIELEQVALDEDNSLPIDAPQESDHLAQAILLAARLLLSRAHREKIKTKSQLPPPMAPKEDRPESLPILRPLVSLLQHCSHVMQINAYVANVQDLMKKAHIPGRVKLARVDLLANTQGTIDTESLLSALLQPLSAEASIIIDSLPPFQLSVGTSPQDIPFFIFSYTKEGKSYPWDSVNDLLQRADQQLPDHITQHIASLDGGWIFRPKTGKLVKKDDSAKHCVSVELEGSAGILTLLCGKQSAKWVLDSDAEDQRKIVDALTELSKD